MIKGEKYMNILLDATIGPTIFFKEMFFLLILSVIGAKSVWCANSLFLKTAKTILDSRFYIYVLDAGFQVLDSEFQT